MTSPLRAPESSGIAPDSSAGPVRPPADAAAPSGAAPDSAASLPGSATDLPRPPADVLGGDWSVWLVAAVAVAAVALLALAVLAYRRWAGRRSAASGLSTARPPREEALRELDRIRSLGWHRNGRVTDFYASSTDALRRFAERLEPAWTGSLTSGELLARMEERWGRERIRSLTPAVEAAEQVKFGGRSPGADTAEDDWRTIRDWIRRAPEAP